MKLHLDESSSGRPDDALDQKPELKSIDKTFQSLDLFTIVLDSKHWFSQGI